MRLLLSLVTLVAIVLFGNSVSAFALSYPSTRIGEDVSWPNCGHILISKSSFGIVGVTGGLAFNPNVCLGNEAGLYHDSLSLYVNGGFPGEPYDLKYQYSPLNCQVTDISCMAYNYGYNSSLYAFNYALSHGIVSNNWWIDVETVNSWANSSSINISNLKGEAVGIAFASGASLVGFYSYPAQWKTITNGWNNDLPIWQPTDNNSLKSAIELCKTKGFSGTNPLLVQYLNSRETLDLDYAC